MCDKSSIFAWFDAMITQKSHDHAGYRAWFHFWFEHDVAHAFWKPRQMKIAAHATPARARDLKHQSNHRRTQPAAGSQINVTL